MLPETLPSGPQLGTWRPGGAHGCPSSPFPCSSALSSPDTHQLQGLAGAAAQGSPGDAQRVSKQHQLLGVAQLVGGTLGMEGCRVRLAVARSPLLLPWSSPILWSFPSLHVLPGCSVPLCPAPPPSHLTTALAPSSECDASTPIPASPPEHCPHQGPPPQVPSQPSPAPPLLIFSHVPS